MKLIINDHFIKIIPLYYLKGIKYSTVGQKYVRIFVDYLDHVIVDVSCKIPGGYCSSTFFYGMISLVVLYVA